MLSDKVKLSEHSNLILATPISVVLPTTMLCKYNHKVNGYTIFATNGHTIPFYLCELCEVVYRYQELIPLTD